MMLPRLLAAFALSLLIPIPGIGAPAVGGARVEVVLLDSGDFHRGDERELQALIGYFEQRAAQSLPPDCMLHVTLTRIDRTGRYEWWHGAGAAGTRFVRDVYTPRIDLDFQLACTAGTAAAGGHRELRDQTFAFASTAHQQRGDPLRYEKKLIDDWLGRELPQRAAAEAAGHR